MNKMIKLLFPDKCIICGNITLSDYPLCDSCIPVFLSLFTEPCPDCKKDRNACNCSNKSKIAFLFYYKSKAAKRIAHNIKYNANKTSARFAAELMVKSLKTKQTFDCVTYPPRQKKNINKYGYDQSKIIAENIADILNIPCVALLKRNHKTVDQKLLSARQRFENIKNVFSAVNKTFDYKRVLFIDDVITTGATVNECSKILKNTGIEQIKIACICKTPKARKIGAKQIFNKSFKIQTR
ncbi:hypothetical protein LJB90_00710 [Eubacteriales bacterium OttesenSCG-928-G02]|nr:hypothetical protein [Eubacteriales bacterium OttesenSCG-928-G02]